MHTRITHATTAIACALALHTGCQATPNTRAAAATRTPQAPTDASPHNPHTAQRPTARATFKRTTPQQANIDPKALERLKARAIASRSDALVVLRHGELVLEWYAEGAAPAPIEAMSATKSIVSLAVGVLVDQGKVALDQPVHDFFPEWNQGRKRDITVKHILTHTTGLHAKSNTAEIYRSPDFVRLALAAELVSDPGEAFFYNNKAVNLLAGIVQAASGQRMDRFITDALFAPLGIQDTGWTLDKAGNPHAMSGLQIRALDMARIGQLVLNRGRWGERQLVSEAWIDASLARGAVPSCGLLWWRRVDWESVTITPEIIARWHKAGVDQAKIVALKPIYNTPLSVKAFNGEVARLWNVTNTQAAFKAEMWSKGVPNGDWKASPRTVYMAEGYLGQYIYIEPHSGLVGVRQMAWRPDYKDAANADAMVDFEALMRALVQP